MTLPVPSTIKLTSGRRSNGYTNISLAAGEARENETILLIGCSSHMFIGSSSWIRQD
ncbi:hypothetical protein [Acidisoma sp. L85]|uniref:hypothetical protein n=1 Tax=Acidisoma sp. L85 TaxID=1641850 RepID=UPI00131BB766|nr:hypothetical protein [Acidisoma sp. L85]